MYEEAITPPSCLCLEDDFNMKLEIPHLLINSSEELPEEILDFGEVEVGSEKCLNLQIENKENSESHYTIKRESTINPMYQVFDIRTPKFRVAPLQSKSVKVVYKPLFAMNSDVDYFDVVDSKGGCMKVQVQGVCAGPEVQISSAFLRFNAWPGRNCVKQTIELRNSSDYPAHFYFDIDDNPNSVFRLDTIYGTIDAKKYIFVTITFEPRGDFGHFSQRLYCLIKNHEPLFVNLYGIYAKKKEECRVSIVQYSEKSNGSFQKYMSNVQMEINRLEDFSLSEPYLDFEGVLFGKEKLGCNTLATILTNHTDKIISVKWSLTDENFKISPLTAKISENDSRIFECNFKPTVEDMLFTRNIQGNIYLNNEKPTENTPIPMPITLRVIGHSFAENSFWIPLLEIDPEMAILPPCIPGEITFTTITLKSTGFLPVSFKFLSPKKTNFIVKPMIGIVHGSKQIVVQHQADKGNRSKVYIEKWCALLNGHQTHKIPFYIKGLSESPSVLIGEKNKVLIKGVQIGCTETRDVVIKNNSHHHIMYEFLTNHEDDEVVVKTPQGFLTSGAKKLLTFAYNCKTKDCKKKFIPCYIRRVRKSRQVFGEPKIVNVEVYLESGDSELCCIPRGIDFGNALCHSAYATKFKIFNFGTTTVHCALLGKSFEGKISDEVDIEPDILSLEPKSNRLIFLRCHATQIGYRRIDICYRIRKDATSKEDIERSDKSLFLCEMNAQYPYFQIIDIADHNFGPLFSKASLWETLNINQWNATLKNIKCMENIGIDLAVPDVEYNDACLYAVFVLKNMSHFPVPAALKRHRICNCQLQEIDEFMSRRKKVYLCPHRELFKLDLSGDQIEVESVQLMKLEIKGKLEGNTRMSYCLQLSHARRITLNFEVMVIGRELKWISKYHPTFDMKFANVCVREKEPFVQCFWLYNNTGKRAEYEVCVESLNRLNKLYGFTVFECLNPSGFIDNYTSWPIMFRYIAIEVKTIQLDVPLFLGGSKFELHVSVEGTAKFAPASCISPIIKPGKLIETIPVHLSEYVLVVKPFPVWRSSSRLISIDNISRDIIAYSWQSSSIEGIVDVSVRNAKGILRPSESELLLIKVRASGTPCKTRVHLPCKLMNHTKYLQYKASVFAHETQQQRIQDEFIINEQGIHYLNNTVQILECPRQSFITLAIEITITSSDDVDLEYDVEEQQKLCPQISLEWNKTYDKSKKDLLAILDNLPDEFCDSNSSKSLDELVMIAGFDDKEFYSQVIDCIISDCLFSNIFRKLMDIIKFHNPTYYTQMKSCEEPKREQLVSEMYEQPDASLVSEVFQEILADSMTEVFNMAAKKPDPINYNDEIDGGLTCKCQSTLQQSEISHETPPRSVLTCEYFGE